MRIKLLVSRSGPAGAFSPGDIIDVGDAEAQRMFDAGQAVPDRSGDVVETAVSTPVVERATKRGR